MQVQNRQGSCRHMQPAMVPDLKLSAVAASLPSQLRQALCRSAQDVPQAAEHLVSLTRNLGEQPFAKQVQFLSFRMKV